MIPSFKKLIVVTIESRNKMLYIPKGIAHGFLSLKDNTIVNYKCDNLYNPSYESGINPFISNINLDFGINEVDLIISDNWDSFYYSIKWLLRIITPFIIIYFFIKERK